MILYSLVQWMNPSHPEPQSAQECQGGSNGNNTGQYAIFPQHTHTHIALPGKNRKTF